MKKIPRNIAKIDADIRTAGKAFLGMRLSDMLKRVNELDNQSKRADLIYEYYTNQQGTYDREIEGTSTRVNAAIRIIKADKVLYALESIVSSNSRVLPKAVSNAKDTIKKISTGEIELPMLY